MQHFCSQYLCDLQASIMNKKKSCLAAQKNIYKSLAPFYYFSKFFGLTFYSLDLENGNIKTRVYNWILFGLVFCGYSFGVVASLFSVSSIHIEVVNKTVSNGKIYQFILQLFLSCFIISWNLWNRSIIEQFLKNLFQFDQIILKQGFKYKIDHAKIRYMLMFWLVLSCICLIFNLIFTYLLQENEIEKLLLYILNYYVILTFTMNIFQFIFSTYAVISRFEVLIQNTRHYLSPNNYVYFWTETPMAKKSQIARKITILNDLLHDAIENINSIFSIQVVPNYLLILIGDVFVFYSIVLTWKSETFSGTTIIMFIINNMYQSIPITISIHFGSVVVKKSQQMAIVVGKIITSSDEKEVIERVSFL